MAADAPISGRAELGSRSGHLASVFARLPSAHGPSARRPLTWPPRSASRPSSAATSPLLSRLGLGPRGGPSFTWSARPVRSRRGPTGTHLRVEFASGGRGTCTAIRRGRPRRMSTPEDQARSSRRWRERSWLGASPAIRGAELGCPWDTSPRRHHPSPALECALPCLPVPNAPIRTPRSPTRVSFTPIGCAAPGMEPSFGLYGRIHHPAWACASSAWAYGTHGCGDPSRSWAYPSREQEHPLPCMDVHIGRKGMRVDGKDVPMGLHRWPHRSKARTQPT